MTEITIEAKWQLKQVKLLMIQLQEKRLKRTLAAIVNESAKQVEAKAETIVADETYIPKKQINKRIFIRKQKKAQPRFLETEITGSASPIPLGVMNAKEYKKGNGVGFGATGKRVHLPHAFLKGGKFPDRVKIRGRGPHVFERLKNSSRQFKALPGIAISESMGKQQNLDALTVIAHQRLEANLKRMLAGAIYAQNNNLKRK